MLRGDPVLEQKSIPSLHALFTDPLLSKQFDASLEENFFKKLREQKDLISSLPSYAAKGLIYGSIVEKALVDLGTTDLIKLEKVIDSAGYNPLIRAARSNNQKLFTRLLDECHYDVNFKTSFGITADWFLVNPQFQHRAMALQFLQHPKLAENAVVNALSAAMTVYGLPIQCPEGSSELSLEDILQSGKVNLKDSSYKDSVFEKFISHPMVDNKRAIEIFDYVTSKGYYVPSEAVVSKLAAKLLGNLDVSSHAFLARNLTTPADAKLAPECSAKGFFVKKITVTSHLKSMLDNAIHDFLSDDSVACDGAKKLAVFAFLQEKNHYKFNPEVVKSPLFKAYIRAIINRDVLLDEKNSLPEKCAKSMRELEGAQLPDVELIASLDRKLRANAYLILTLKHHITIDSEDYQSVRRQYDLHKRQLNGWTDPGCAQILDELTKEQGMLAILKSRWFF